ncbi:MAG: AI-2E family transporter [Candidatus Pacebacteria bacterium]|nr:AI-2E family transporter [Candidatus Paceibacterota bacterium]
MNATVQARYKTVFFSIVFICFAILSALIFWPFLTPLALAGIVSILIHPVYRKVLKFLKSESLASVVTIVLLVVLILAPLTIIANQIISEAQNLYSSVSSGESISVDFLTTKVEVAVQKYIPDFTINTREYLSSFASWVVDRLGGIFSGTLDLVVKFALSIVALFYFLRDGEEFKKQIIALSPLSDDKDKFISVSLKSSINSVLMGSIAVALVQGILSGIGFTLFGVPNATLWGTVAGVAALVPGVGTSLVWIPASIYLYFYGSSGIWVVEILWSILLVGLIDNFLAPFIINKGVNIHPLLILFSILGGLQFFGAEGFLLGPIVVGLLFALIRIVKVETN